MNARCLPLGPRELAQNAADAHCQACGGTGLVFVRTGEHNVRNERCVCTRALPRTQFATLAEATEACAGDPWRTPGWTGQAWVLGQMREHPCTCPKCGHKHFAWTDVCNERCNGPAFGGGA